MTEKPKVALYWCASCGGCEEAVVDLAEKILEVVAAVDIIFWPVALDFKRSDVEAMKDGSILVTFLNGAIRTDEQQEMVYLLRRKSRLMVAFGSCSWLGGIPGLANLYSREAILRTVYAESPSTVNPEDAAPQMVFLDDGRRLTLPGFHDTVLRLDQVVDVDYSLPGCPPTPELIQEALTALLGGALPPKGAVLAPDHALCEACPRKDTRPERLLLKEFKRPHETLIDQENCLLAQGLLCLGPVTRAGCRSLCIGGNMPCTGCFGPTSRVRDFGAKALSAIASIVDSNDDREVAHILERIPDPAGTFYRYSLSSSLLPRLRAGKVAAQEVGSHGGSDSPKDHD